MIADANISISAQKDAVRNLQSEVDALRERYLSFTPAAQEVAESLGQGSQFASEQERVLNELNKNQEI